MKKNVIGIFALLVVIFVITAIINPKFLNAYNMQNISRFQHSLMLYLSRE